MSQALSIRHTAADSTARLNAQSSTQAKRYWPGKAPDWAEKEADRTKDIDSEEEQAPEEDEPVATAVKPAVVLKKVNTCSTSVIKG